MIQTDPIFLGVVPRGARSYLAREIVRLGRPLFNTCGGRFSVIEAAVKQGFPAAKVHASDIGLFSSLIGYLADDSKRLEDLGIRILDPDLEPRDVRDSRHADPETEPDAPKEPARPLPARRMGRGNTSALEAGLWQTRESGEGAVDHRQPVNAGLRGEPHRIRGRPQATDLRRPRDHRGLPGRPADCPLLPRPLRPPAG